jgi:hypothetical protein
MMPLEQQVVILEPSKRLRDLGVKQESLYAHLHRKKRAIFDNYGNNYVRPAQWKIPHSPRFSGNALNPS